MLIVVGREDTGDLESQIRGSKHAWDMRVISIDALIQLVLLKEGTEEKETLRKIQTLLTPIEYTRLDNLVDVLFTTAKDVETSTVTVEADLNELSSISVSQSEQTNEPRKQLLTDANEMAQLREAVMSAFSQKRGAYFTAKSKAMFWTADKSIRVCCTLSKQYQRGGQQLYWYAFHPRWQQFLTEGQQGYCIFGCVGRKEAFALPLDFIQEHLEHCYTTEREDRFYWHIELIEEEGEIFWLLRKSNQSLPLSPYKIAL